jgi:CheY-like chemotaxis protein
MLPPDPLQLPSNLRLLLVDDDPVLLKSLRDALEADGHLITTADGGKMGIAEFNAALERGAPYAAVITDLGMPHVDGRKVATAIKGASPTTPVILLTGWGQRMIADQETPSHVDRVLAKPPKLREVREVLAQLCPLPALGLTP